MAKKTKTILLIICGFLFFLVTPTIILYCNGYRFDFQNRRIVKTGAFYFSVTPKTVKISLNGIIEKKTDFFFGSALLENLLPQEYSIRISKKGFQDWNKKLEIKANEATEVKNIFLMPEKVHFSSIEEKVDDFWFSPDKNKIILKQDTAEDEWLLKLYDVKREIKSHIVSQEEILESSLEVKIISIKWSLDSKRLLLAVRADGKIKYFFFNTDLIPIKPTLLTFAKEIKEVFLHPNNSNIVFTTQIDNDGLLILEEVNLQEQIRKQIIKKAVALKITEKEIYFLNEEGFVEKNNFSNDSQVVNLSPILIDRNVFYQIFVSGSELFILENSKLSYFNPDIKTFQEVGNNVDAIMFSPNKNRICFWNDFEIWVYFIKEEGDQPQKQTRSKVLLVRFSEEVAEPYWQNNDMLVFRINENIKAIEIDNRDKIQIWDLTKLQEPKIFFNELNKKLYVLSNNDFFVSQSF